MIFTLVFLWYSYFMLEFWMAVEYWIDTDECVDIFRQTGATPNWGAAVFTTAIILWPITLTYIIYLGMKENGKKG